MYKISFVSRHIYDLRFKFFHVNKFAPSDIDNGSYNDEPNALYVTTVTIPDLFTN